MSTHLQSPLEGVRKRLDDRIERRNQAKAEEEELLAQARARRAEQAELLIGIHKDVEEHPELLAWVDLSTGDTPLITACREGRLSYDLAQTLLDAYPSSAALIDCERNTALHLYCGSDEVSLVDVAVIRLLVDAHPMALRMRNVDGMLPLHTCCQRSNLQGPAIIELFHHHPDALEILVEGNTPVHRLVQLHRCHRDLPQVLASLVKTKPEALLVRNDEDETALEIVMLAKDADIEDGVADLIISTVPETISQQDTGGWTVMHGAVGEKRLHGLARRMINKCPQVLKLKLENGSIPIHAHCTIALDLELLRPMLEAWPLSTLVVNDEGSIAYDFVSLGDDDEAATALLLATTKEALAAVLECIYSPKLEFESEDNFDAELKDTVRDIVDPLELPSGTIMDGTELWEATLSQISIDKIRQIVQVPGMQELIQHDVVAAMACGLIKMRRARRFHESDDPFAQEQATLTLGSSSGSLDCLHYLYLVQTNPRVCYNTVLSHRKRKFRDGED